MREILQAARRAGGVPGKQKNLLMTVQHADPDLEMPPEKLTAG